MKKKDLITSLSASIALLLLFALWTIAVQTVDVENIGVNGTAIGFAQINCFIHSLLGVNLTAYLITDWLGLIPLAICIGFAIFGFIQLVKRKSLLKVDCDILILGVYYIIVIFCYLVFEMFPINFRPILIDGIMEASYPSSTTLLVLCVMPTLIEQTQRRVKNISVKKAITVISVLFSAFMFFGRLISGVHWFTDIFASILLSFGLFYLYRTFVILTNKK